MAREWGTVWKNWKRMWGALEGTSNSSAPGSNGISYRFILDTKLGRELIKRSGNVTEGEGDDLGEDRGEEAGQAKQGRQDTRGQDNLDVNYHPSSTTYVRTLSTR